MHAWARNVSWFKSVVCNAEIVGNHPTGQTLVRILLKLLHYFALNFYEVLADSAYGPINYQLIEVSSSQRNC